MARKGLLAPLFLLLSTVLGAADPAWAPLDRVYKALEQKQYAEAIASFEQAIAAAPERAAIYKDLAYTLLKVGETEQARDRFAQAMRLQPEDDHSALEYAFLCFETKQQAEARRVFDRVRRRGNATAEKAFQNIDRELADGIARWTRAVELAPDQFSAHEELARLAEQRDDFDLAAKHYARAWELRPDLRAFLLHLGRLWKRAGSVEKANAALLAASRGAEPRIAETARELLPRRYPFVYEFQAALALDPRNIPLRRELAYLHLEMGQKADAEVEFRQVLEAEPEDSLSAAQLGFLLLNRGEKADGMPLVERALAKADDDLADRIREALGRPRVLRTRTDVPQTKASADAHVMAEKSLEAGYLKDALKYLRIAHENDPVDFSLMLKLGQTYNVLKDDRQAIEWFRLALKSSDPKIASQANQAYKNLRPGLARVRTTTWMLPFYSSRWKDVFSYAQVKTELNNSRLPVRLYLSTRFSGDVRRTTSPTTAGLSPQYLSESAFIPGVGIASRPWRGMTLWGEAGMSISYLRRQDVGRFTPDYRGGLAWGRGFGQNLGTTARGLFFETSVDALYISRFDNDALVYGQTKTGFTLGDGFRTQLYWNANMTADAKRYSWANSVETGPGIRFRFNGLPRSLYFSVDALMGRHTVLDGTRPAQYSDFRAGFWYAFTH